MSAWILTPALVALRAEFNLLAPNRDRGADGSIGDTAHTSSSDHTPDEDSRVLRDHDADGKNEVHALDVDSSGPWPGTGSQHDRFHAIVMRIIAGEREKWRSETDMCRLNYVIWDRHIYDKDNDFRPVKYTRPDPHTNHAHFSGRYEARAESDTRLWGVYVPPAPKPEEPVSDETITLTETAGRELFEPDRPAGTVVSEDTIDQLAAIWGKRGAEMIAEVRVLVQANADQLAEIKALIQAAPVDPAAS